MPRSIYERPYKAQANVLRRVLMPGAFLILFRGRTSSDPDGDFNFVEIDFDGFGSGLVRNDWIKDSRYFEDGDVVEQALDVFWGPRYTRAKIATTQAYAIVERDKATGLLKGWLTLCRTGGGMPQTVDEIAYRFRGGERLSLGEEDPLYTAGDWAIVPGAVDSLAYVNSAGDPYVNAAGQPYLGAA